MVSQGSPCILTVSIIITVYSQHLNLAKVLAALTHQTYPQNLMEIIIVDDGNSSEISQIVSKYQKYLNLIHLNQNNLIHSVYAARNLAIQAAKHDYLITLDCNLLPEPKLVESYMKFFHVTDQAILIGNLQSACLNNITDDEILNNFNTNFCLDLMIPHNQIEQEFINSQIEADLKLNFSEEHNYKKDQRWSFRGFTGVNAAYPKKAHQEAGYYNPNLFDHNLLGCSEADAEMGYRFYNAGYYFIPVRDSLSLYSSSIQDKNKLEITPPINNKISQLSEKCPAPFYRPYQPGKLYQVPKVSIYIPVYNREKYIKQAIDSALNQTYTDLEVCICNDGSTDNTLKIIEDNYSDNPRVRWISQPNRGISNASNNAVKMCRGMYIGHLDSDDFLKPHAVELAVNYLDNHNVGCICCSSNEIVDEAGNYVRNFSFHVEFSREAFLVGNMALPFRMFRKRDWNRTSGFDESLPSAEDYDLYLKLSEVCYFHHLDSANYCYRWHGGNISLEGRRAQEKSHIIIINKALARLGLSNKWKAISASLTNVRDVKFIRIDYDKA
ncbi:MAG: glycosyltransferase [Cyanobacteria bacterium J06621_8]